MGGKNDQQKPTISQKFKHLYLVKLNMYFCFLRRSSMRKITILQTRKHPDSFFSWESTSSLDDLSAVSCVQLRAWTTGTFSKVSYLSMVSRQCLSTWPQVTSPWPHTPWCLDSVMEPWPQCGTSKLWRALISAKQPHPLDSHWWSVHLQLLLDRRYQVSGSLPLRVSLDTALT